MVPNPALGVIFHWLGGLAAGSFYVPFRRVQGWSWETYWLVGGVFSWIIAPWSLALALTNDLIACLGAAPVSTLVWCYAFGVLWGVGGLTFGLAVRYLGLSLGVAVALGYCALFGTLLPPLLSGEFVPGVLGTLSGRVILVGMGVCVAGIAMTGLAGVAKERQLESGRTEDAVPELALEKGILIATLCGVMSACFSLGLAAGEPIRELTLARGTPPLWQGLPVLVVVLLGGFTTNFLWCARLNLRNGTGDEYFRRPTPSARLAWNYVFAALAGVTWYAQFFFYTMGETQMGAYAFSSWTLHMASIIIFGTIWGLVLHEWKGAGARPLRLLTLGITVLIVSTIIVGYGNYLALAG